MKAKLPVMSAAMTLPSKGKGTLNGQKETTCVVCRRDVAIVYLLFSLGDEDEEIAYCGQEDETEGMLSMHLASLPES